MASKRDNFSNKIIETLRSRVGNRCSNPDCRVPTTGPTKDPHKINNIGVAAHITAAAPGGPRYDEHLSSKERKAISNAIWLCSNCSRNIDNNPKKFTVELLHKWKRNAEVTAANAHDATSIALEKLDRRFIINTKYHDGVTHFELRPRETVNAQFKVAASYIKEFSRKYTNFENYGEKLIIDGSAISFKGSPLLETITSNLKGEFEISSTLEKNILVKVWLVCPNTNTIHTVNDFTGKAVLGKKAITYKTRSLNGLVELKIRHNIQEENSDNQNITFTTQ